MNDACTSGSKMTGATLKVYLYDGGSWVYKGSCTISGSPECSIPPITLQRGASTWKMVMTPPGGHSPCPNCIRWIASPGYKVDCYTIRWDNINGGTYGGNYTFLNAFYFK